MEADIQLVGMRERGLSVDICLTSLRIRTQAAALLNLDLEVAGGNRESQRLCRNVNKVESLCEPTAEPQSTAFERKHCAAYECLQKSASSAKQRAAAQHPVMRLHFTMTLRLGLGTAT